MTRSNLFKIIALCTGVIAAGLLTGAYAASYGRGDPHKGHRSERHDDNRGREQQAIRDAVARGEVMPLPKILVIAQKAVPGDILEVELEQESWGLKYELKILTASGRVRKVDINAKTGAIVKIEDD